MNYFSVSLGSAGCPGCRGVSACVALQGTPEALGDRRAACLELVPATLYPGMSITPGPAEPWAELGNHLGRGLESPRDEEPKDSIPRGSVFRLKFFLVLKGDFTKEEGKKTQNPSNWYIVSGDYILLIYRLFSRREEIKRRRKKETEGGKEKVHWNYFGN